MNVEQLKALIDQLLADEDQYNIQGALKAFNGAMLSLSNNPTDSNLQIAQANSKNQLEEKITSLSELYDPVTRQKLIDIGANNFFTEELFDKIQDSINANSMTPAVVQKQVAVLLDQRRDFLERLKAITTGLDKLNIAADTLQEGEAEIGFRIPRDLFSNELEPLIKELKAIRHIVMAFSELANKGAVEAIEVKSISTSDPIFFLGLDIETVKLIGGAVTWAVVTWKEFEKARKLRAETKALNIHTEAEIKQLYDDKINDGISKAIAKKADELVGAQNVPGRTEEQRTHINQALRSLFARIERGMTVEIHFIAPPEPADNAEAQERKRHNQFEKLAEIKSKLVFPKASKTPILELPKPVENAKSTGVEPNKSKAKPARKKSSEKK